MLENPNIVLTGFMATGKTSVGKEVSRLTGMGFADADSILEERFGLTVEEIFKIHGEEKFRAEERKLAIELSLMRNSVIATGGGMVTDPDSRRALEGSGELFCLRATVDTILKRAGKSSLRPLLVADDRVRRIEKLLESREGVYRNIKNQIDTDDLSATEVAVLILKSLSPGLRRVMVKTTDGASYPVIIGRGVSKKLPGLLADFGTSREVFLITDSNVHALHASRLCRTLENGGYIPRIFVFPAGEMSKAMETVKAIYSFLGDGSAQRDSTMIAFGGGVVGDVAGFAASTYMRGISLVHIPTTLMAQSDSSVGGKNAVNSPQAKNLIGTFHNPRMVLTDPNYLLTLPERELRSGLAEVVKTAIIGGEDAFTSLEVLIDHIAVGEITLLEPVILRSIKQKARIVSRDPYEEDERRVLNLGHTFGHAIEQGYGYSDVSHGEAVALGIHTATELSLKLGKIPCDHADRIVNLLKRTGLLGAIPFGTHRDLLRTMVLDKKARKGKLALVLPFGIGKVRIVENIEVGTLGEILEELYEEDTRDSRSEFNKAGGEGT